MKAEGLMCLPKSQVDNLGWGELGVYGGELRGATTPRLDQLAQESMGFQNFNVEPQCTLSRSCLRGRC